MILERIKSLLTPKVSPEAKVSGIALFLGKTLDQFGGRIESLESRQLERGDVGDKGDPG